MPNLVEGLLEVYEDMVEVLLVLDESDALAGEEELANLVQRIDKASTTAYGMEISAEKTKLMTNSTRCISLNSRIR